MAMSLVTPKKIRRLQRKLYLKAKTEPEFRFYLLYDKIYREDILEHAYRLAKANGGAPGVDEVTFEMIEEQGLQEWLTGIREDLRAKTYKPQAVRRVMIPKANGGKRPLGIPTVRDRVVQTATKLVIEPVFEADLEPNAYGYRPKRSGLDAVRKVQSLLYQGYTDVVDADLSKYFDTIPHHELMRCLARRIVDKNVLHLIKLWLKAPVEERDDKGNRRMTGGRQSRKGTPQGGVISPLLANIYLNLFLSRWKEEEKGETFRAEVVAYADDFVILSRGSVEQSLEWTRAVIEELGLKLNEEKTSVLDAWQERFDFLGYTFGKHWSHKHGKCYLGASPSKRSVRKLKRTIRKILAPTVQRPWPEVCELLNAVLRGWSGYFSFGQKGEAYRTVERFVYDRVRGFLSRRHKVPSRGTRRFPYEVVFGKLGVIELRRPLYAAESCAQGEASRKAGCGRSACPV